MTLSINGTEFGQIIEIASLVGSIVAMLIAGLLVYLMVRPPRHVRQARKAERRGEAAAAADPVEPEELWRLVDRMESRLAVLERALADQLDRPAIRGRETQRILAPAGDENSGRTE